MLGHIDTDDARLSAAKLCDRSDDKVIEVFGGIRCLTSHGDDPLYAVAAASEPDIYRSF